MLGSWRLLDRILRGAATHPSQMHEGRLSFPVVGLSTVGIVLAMAYGACMGCFSIFRALDVPDHVHDFRQLAATTVKTPALFFLTLVITFPSLYVFNALVGSRLTFTSVLRLLIAAISVNLAVLASLGPIVAFFSLSTNSYGFMVLLNVAVFSVAGMLGLMFLVQTLDRLQRVQEATDVAHEEAELPDAETKPAAGDEFVGELSVKSSGALDPLHDHGFQRQTRAVFAVWIIVFSLVGAQMGWILRPFIGSPGLEFQWLRPRQSNFFEAVGATFGNLMLGTSRTDASENSPGDLRRALPDDERGLR
jgi:hypothetical protein